MQPKKILFVLGTRPEAIKLCPLILGLGRLSSRYQVRVCVTAQHRHMLDQVLSIFGVKPDHDLDLMSPGQTLLASTSRILAGLEPVLDLEKPDMAVVQGDTTTTFCGSLAAFYKRIPVAHVEAGLRTGDLQQPFPEELNRRLASRMTTLHFAPTSSAAENLRREGIPPDQIEVTGNTGIDALLYVEREFIDQKDTRDSWLVTGKKQILVTAHRRESFGPGLHAICLALKQLAERDDVHIIFPVHPNPNVQGPVRRHLGAHPRVTLIDALDYVEFVGLMSRSYLLLTDSGGIQEEAPSLGKPVLVLRETTERPEAVLAGTAKLVGTDVDRIVGEASRLLDSENAYAGMTRRHNPYGDGHACERIENRLRRFFGFPAAAHRPAHPSLTLPPPVP